MGEDVKNWRFRRSISIQGNYDYLSFSEKLTFFDFEKKILNDFRLTCFFDKKNQFLIYIIFCITLFHHHFVILGKKFITFVRQVILLK